MCCVTLWIASTINEATRQRALITSHLANGVPLTLSLGEAKVVSQTLCLLCLLISLHIQAVRMNAQSMAGCWLPCLHKTGISAKMSSDADKIERPIEHDDSWVIVAWWDCRDSYGKRKKGRVDSRTEIVCGPNAKHEQALLLVQWLQGTTKCLFDVRFFLLYSSNSFDSLAVCRMWVHATPAEHLGTRLPLNIFHHDQQPSE